MLFLVELFVAAGLGQTVHLDRPAMAQAWLEWHQHPTPETRAAFARQKRITEGVRWAFSGAVFAVLAGGTLHVYRLRRGEASGVADGSQPFNSPRGSGFGGVDGVAPEDVNSSHERV